MKKQIKEIKLKKKFEKKFMIRRKTGLWINKDTFSPENVWFFIHSAIEEATKIKKHNIGMLRQWLNERTGDRLLTNEDLEMWLNQDYQSQGNYGKDKGE